MKLPGHNSLRALEDLENSSLVGCKLFGGIVHGKCTTSSLRPSGSVKNTA